MTLDNPEGPSAALLRSLRSFITAVGYRGKSRRWVDNTPPNQEINGL